MSAATPADGTTHLDRIRAVTPSSNCCDKCLRIGAWWVHLRECMTCGHVACCDSSPHPYASQHARASGHPVVRSFGAGETWMWCYLDRVFIDASGHVRGG